MLARIKKRKGLLIGIGVLLTLAVTALAPWVLWRLSPNRPFEALVIDKTVARPDYRKHAGLFWVMRHEKIVKPGTEADYDIARDYVGYQHDLDGRPRIVPIPNRQTDMTYVADTYGVYKDDLRAKPLGVKSDLIYGGLSLDEVRTIINGVRPGGTLIGEFNSIASPTKGAAREELSAALGVRWSGWIGRHFQSLDLTGDMPLWIPRTWKRQTGERWQFRGPGYIFVNELGFLVVLLEGIDTPTPALTVNFDGAHADRFGVARRQTYDYWVEIMEPLPGSEVIGTYRIDLTAEGRRKLKGVPFTDGGIPAVIRSVHGNRRSYYFAGDFASNPNPPTAYRYKWLPEIKRMLAPQHRDDQTAFYWRVYVPLMQTILRETREGVARGGIDPDA